MQCIQCDWHAHAHCLCGGLPVFAIIPCAWARAPTPINISTAMCVVKMAQELCGTVSPVDGMRTLTALRQKTGCERPAGNEVCPHFFLSSRDALLRRHVGPLLFIPSSMVMSMHCIDFFSSRRPAEHVCTFP
jgi:hypothetical protein